MGGLVERRLRRALAMGLYGIRLAGWVVAEDAGHHVPAGRKAQAGRRFGVQVRQHGVYPRRGALQRRLVAGLDLFRTLVHRMASFTRRQ